jgi:hypothetical protein
MGVHKIPLPDSASGQKSGIGLAYREILWLHDEHPRDYQKLIKVFPLAEAVVWRRTFYGELGG